MLFAAWAGILTAFAAAFVLACVDPIWRQRMTLREGWDALTGRDGE